MAKNKYPIVEEFKAYMALNETQEYVQDIYLTDPHGCVPDEYAGEDLAQAIIDKFGWPLNFIRERVLKTLERTWPHIYWMVEPRFEAETRQIVFQTTSKKVLYFHSINAWNFWFSHEGLLSEYLESVEREILENLKPAQEG